LVEALAGLNRKTKAATAPIIRIHRMLVKEGKTLAQVHDFLDQKL